MASADVEKAFKIPNVSQVEQTEVLHAYMYAVFTFVSLSSTTEESPLRLEE
jgi:hypothetical protein